MKSDTGQFQINLRENFTCGAKTVRYLGIFQFFLVPFSTFWDLLVLFVIYLYYLVLLVLFGIWLAVVLWKESDRQAV